MSFQHKLPITLPREVSGQELANAVEIAAKVLEGKGYNVGFGTNPEYKKDSVQEYGASRTIAIFPGRNLSALEILATAPLNMFSGIPLYSDIRFDIKTNRNYSELENEGTFSPVDMKSLEQYKRVYETFVEELNRQLE